MELPDLDKINTDDMPINKAKCIWQWRWHAINPGKDKYDYKASGGVTSPKNGCWACYVKALKTNRTSLRSCLAHCPVTAWRSYGCMKWKSSYYKWHEAIISDRPQDTTKYALEILEQVLNSPDAGWVIGKEGDYHEATRGK